MSKKDTIKGVDSFLSTYFEDNKFKYLFKNVTGCYFIDYENVTQNGLVGIDKLPEGSVVCLFYSRRADKLPIDTMSAVSVSKVKLMTFKVDVGQRNALDFQLVSMLGYIIAKHRQLKIFPYYHIITKDTGFDSVVNMWCNLGVDIERYGTIDISIDKRKGVDVKSSPQSTVPQASDIKSGLATVSPSTSTSPVSVNLSTDSHSKLKVPNTTVSTEESTLGSGVKNADKGHEYDGLQRMLSVTFNSKTARCIYNIAKGSNKQYREFHNKLVHELGADFTNTWYKAIKEFLPYR